MEAVKGLQGYWHYTNGGWFNKGTLKTLCGGSASPNNRELDWDKAMRIINCPKCKELLESPRV